MARNHTNREIERLKKIAEAIVPNCKKMIEDKEYVCSRSLDGIKCSVYAFPAKKWMNGDCPMADEVLRNMVVEEKTTEKVRAGQQKQKKKK